ncbi:MAG TPA: alpha/beta fold hydrolase [Ktedonobacteraceae bacterium]
MRKRVPPRVSRPPELIRRKRRIRRARNLLFLIIFLGMFALGFNRVVAYEDGIQRSTFTIQGAIAVPVLEMRPASGETAMVAILAHGFAGSKDLMTGFGVELARAGITTYLFDFPGHGESPVPLADNTFSERTAQENTITVGEVVDYVRAHNSATSHPNIILMGHSMGSAAVGDYAMAHSDGDIVSTILISPIGQEHPTLTQPKNLLMLVGQYDLSFAIDNSARLLQAGCGISHTQALPAGCGNPADGTGRRAVVLAGLNHITILNASSTFDETLNWLRRVNPHMVNTGHMQSNIRLFWLLLGVVALLLAMFPLSSITLDLFNIYGTARPFRGQDVAFFDLCAIAGIAVAIAVQYAWRPFGFVHVLLADYVSGYFFFTAAVLALLVYMVRRILPIPLFRQTTKQIFVGVLLWLFLYITLGQLVTFAWQRFTFTLPRLWRFGIIFVLVWPLFLLDEGINRGYQEQGTIRAIAASLAFKILLVAGLLVAVLVTPGLGFLSIVLPVVALLFLLLVAFGTQVYASGRAAITGATLSALILAWSMSTTLPIS